MLEAQAHRPYPAPKSSWLMFQTWHDALLAHWAMPAAVVRRVLPEPLPLDTYEGKAWLSVVAFGVRRFHPRGLPPLPKLSAFPQVNLRTYVTIDNKPGIYIFSADTNSLPSVFGARSLFHVNYFRAQTTVKAAGESVHFHSQRKPPNTPAAFEARYWPAGKARTAERESLAYWLVERYCQYGVDQHQKVYRSEIHHLPWHLQPVNAVLETNTLGDAIGISLADEPQVTHYTKRQDVLLWFRERI